MGKQGIVLMMAKIAARMVLGERACSLANKNQRESGKCDSPLGLGLNLSMPLSVMPLDSSWLSRVNSAYLSRSLAWECVCVLVRVCW